MPTYSLPQGMGSIEALMKRFEKAKERRELWRSLFQEAYDYALPQKETFRFYSPGQRKNRHVYDSTAPMGVRTFASRLQASLTPPWQQWVDMVAGTEIPKEERDNVNQKLEEVTEIFFNYLNHSDFSNQANESNQDLAIGTGALLFEQGDELKGEPLFKFTSVPLSQLYVEEPSGSRIDTFWREHETLARNLEKMWPQGDFSGELGKMIENQPDAKVKVLNGVLKSDMDYVQVIIYPAEKKLIFTQSFEESPGIIYRWSVIPGEVYGRGPVIDCLPDIRTVNKVKEFVLKNGALQMTGVYTALSDGTFNPYSVNISPGSIIPVGSNSNQNPSLRPLENSGRLDVGQLILEDLQNTINEALFANPMGDLEDPVRSATEQMLRNQEMLRNAGASFGRLKTEMLEPIVKRGLGILKREGRLPDIKLDGKEITLKMQSPLAKAEAMEDFNNFQIWFAQLSQLPPEIQALGAKLENIPNWTAEKLGLPSNELARTEDEIKQAQEQILAAAQQQIGNDSGSPEQ